MKFLKVLVMAVALMFVSVSTVAFTPVSHVETDGDIQFVIADRYESDIDPMAVYRTWERVNVQHQQGTDQEGNQVHMYVLYFQAPEGSDYVGAAMVFMQMKGVMSLHGYELAYKDGVHRVFVEHPRADTYAEFNTETGKFVRELQDAGR